MANQLAPSTRPGMGSIPYDGGATFRVWAPHAERVAVAGTFNGWSADANPLASEGNSYWSADVPGAEAGAEYKYVLTSGGQALWQMQAVESAELGPLPLQRAPDPEVHLQEMNAQELLQEDFRSSGMSLSMQPVELWRERLERRGVKTVAQLETCRDREEVSVAGLVICRQRPSTAAGVVFMTLEDETGFVNLVVWERVFSAHSVIAQTASFMGVTGKLQKEDGVVHVVAEKLWIPRLAERPERTRSRDFH